MAAKRTHKFILKSFIQGFIKDSGADNGEQTADRNDETEGEKGEEEEGEVDKEYENNEKLLKMSLRTKRRRYCFSLLLMSSLPNTLSPNNHAYALPHLFCTFHTSCDTYTGPQL